MNADRVWQPLREGLQAWQEAGRRPAFWLRDDDAVSPTPALERLLELTRGNGVPLGLAVIPAHAGEALAERLLDEDHVSALVHGWRHDNHAPPGEKKQELGLHRPLGVVLDEIASGLRRIGSLFARQARPILVPPWNRIHPDLLAHLPAMGFVAVSVFGRPRPAPIAMRNSTVDIIDWHGSRGGREPSALVSEIAAQLRAGLTDPSVPPIGILAHHLVHDEAAWSFLEGLFSVTGDACDWQTI